MRSKLVVILYTVALVAEGIANPCKYWCKMSDWKFYCCDELEKKTEKKDAWASSMAFLIPQLWLALGWPNAIHHYGHGHEYEHGNEYGHDHDHSWEEPTKKCPKVRTVCPRSYNWWFDPPFRCHDDDNCTSSEKCCFDICLEYKTCKPAEIS